MFDRALQTPDHFISLQSTQQTQPLISHLWLVFSPSVNIVYSYCHFYSHMKWTCLCGCLASALCICWYDGEVRFADLIRIFPVTTVKLNQNSGFAFGSFLVEEHFLELRLVSEALQKSIRKQTKFHTDVEKSQLCLEKLAGKSEDLLNFCLSSFSSRIACSVSANNLYWTIFQREDSLSLVMKPAVLQGNCCSSYTPTPLSLCLSPSLFHYIFFCFSTSLLFQSTLCSPMILLY